MLGLCYLSYTSFLHPLVHPGVGGADNSELKRTVSEPYDEHLLFCPDFSHLETILPKLSRRVCFTASEPPRPVKTSQPSEFCPNSCLFLRIVFTFVSFRLVCSTIFLFVQFLYLVSSSKNALNFSWRACCGSQRPASQWVSPQLSQTYMEPGHRWRHGISPPGHPSQLQGTPPPPPAEAGEELLRW